MRGRDEVQKGQAEKFGLFRTARSGYGKSWQDLEVDRQRRWASTELKRWEARLKGGTEAFELPCSLVWTVA